MKIPIFKWDICFTHYRHSSERLNGNKSNSSHSKNLVTPIDSPLTKVKKPRKPLQGDGVTKTSDKIIKRDSGHSITSQTKAAVAKSHISSNTIKASDSRSSRKKKRKTSTSNTTVKRRESPLKKLKTQAIAEWEISVMLIVYSLFYSVTKKRKVLHGCKVIDFGLNETGRSILLASNIFY